MLQRFPSGGKLCTETLVNFDRNIHFLVLSKKVPVVTV